MIPQRYREAVVLVTGAARGLGLRAAERFAAEGARLVLSDLDAAGLDRAAADLRRAGGAVTVHAGDVAREETAETLVQTALSTYGRLDVAINNAGVSHGFKKLSDLDASAAERVLAVNVMGVVHALKHQVPAMERLFAETGRGGAILNVASVAGLVGAPLLSVYAASKHAIVGLTRSVAGETARKGVRINALCPAFTRTEMVTGSVGAMRGGAEEALSRITANVPMRRLGEPDEIVQAMLWICSPENSFMTGQAIAIDGGLSAV